MNRKRYLRPILAIMGIFVTLLIIVGTILIVQHIIQTETPPNDTTTEEQTPESTTGSTPGTSSGETPDGGYDDGNHDMEQPVGGLLFCPNF